MTTSKEISIVLARNLLGGFISSVRIVASPDTESRPSSSDEKATEVQKTMWPLRLLLTRVKPAVLKMAASPA